ncbi:MULTISPECIES: DUF6400 family protein [Actinomycetes]|uniref:Uncharacterized protein n=3 Tax=Actinomycetes TaxID=1760 RepID=A0A1X4H629_9ACTN|nr:MULTISPECIES: DUF6400 family protein [Streptomyces]MCE3030061.1 DUF6400 family protein [Streptomyces sp. CMSTAAHL-2]QNT97488.1 hypothetical protein HEP81_07255 [Streptomyces griseofuscus]RRQ72299.1 hypothetical protein CQW39_32660 [Streptomyces griseofuscus]RRQ86718.1 hypothetical protein CQW44_12905 [Streptomyces griseofuscus]WDO10377.1 DUF6400 family protein [Streptomyces murinus]
MSAYDPTPSAQPVEFSVDLTAHEMLRRAHVMDAVGPTWDPVKALRDEDAAQDLLYSDLDEEQQRIYDQLVAAGVLPERGDGRATA